MHNSILNPQTCRTAAIVVALTLAVSEAYAADLYASDGKYINELHGTIGLGVASIPKYVGSKQTKGELTPVGKITYGRFFAGGAAGVGVGYNAFELGDFSFGGRLSHELIGARKESDDPRLHGLGDVNATTRAGLFASYSHDWLRAAMDVSWDVGGNKEGMLAKLSADALYRPMPRLELSVGPKLTYGDSRYQQTVFGVSQAQSSQSGLPAYTPNSGLTQMSAELGATYALSKSWLIGSKLVAGQLKGDAAKSPIVEKKSQNSFGVFTAYRF